MPHRTVRVAAATIAALGLLTACSGGSGGSGGTSQTPAPAASSGAPSTGSGPKVPAPLPTQVLLNDPCNVLTAAEATEIGLASPGEKTTGSGLIGCQWTSSGSRQNFVGITPLPQNTGGIGDIYAQKARQAYFQPTAIDGYPGLFADTQDGRPSGTCTLWVGVTDQLAVSVIPAIGTGANKSNPCGIAEKFAAVMIKHLKGAA
ncbi:DUF3558 domain-containing protein [Amycolatopsis jejuensis]|uniref:DUF3558 domain-containing protein n=1 Tax=Amycolatopsis jejuensis TaxID=330084 RepID=UPI0005244788|nr:DUF3558 domain-containing protein [Amycolatopsis jejuensis]